MPEIWKPIPHLAPFEASSKGRVRNGDTNRIITPWLTEEDYLLVAFKTKALSTSRFVSRVVCEAFHGESPSRAYQACHIDHDRHNNAPSNLEWKTRKANNADRSKSPVQYGSVTRSRTKLTRECAIRICRIRDRVLRERTRLPRGVMASMARKFDCSQKVVRRVLVGTTWTTVQRELYG